MLIGSEINCNTTTLVMIILPVSSFGLLPFRSFLLATGEDEGEFFLRVCTLGGAKIRREKKNNRVTYSILSLVLIGTCA